MTDVLTYARDPPERAHHMLTIDHPHAYKASK